jgi:hypothetical protein
MGLKLYVRSCRGAELHRPRGDLYRMKSSTISDESDTSSNSGRLLPLTPERRGLSIIAAVRKSFLVSIAVLCFGCAGAHGVQPGKLFLYGPPGGAGGYPRGSTAIVGPLSETSVVPSFAVISPMGGHDVIRIVPSDRAGLGGQTWYFRGTSRPAPDPCYGGGSPEVALSADGNFLACLSGGATPKLLLVDMHAFPKVALRVIATGVAVEGGSPLAFVGSREIAFMKLSSDPSCRSYDPLEGATHGYIMTLANGQTHDLGCLYAVLAGSSAPTMVRRTSATEWTYSKDSGRTWLTGDALGTSSGGDLLAGPHFDINYSGKTVSTQPYTSLSWSEQGQ